MTWLDLDPGEPFGVHNLPYGSLVTSGLSAVVVRVGDRVLNVSAAEEDGLIDAAGDLAGSGNLERFLAAGRPTWLRVREQIQQLLTDERHRPAVLRRMASLSDESARLAMPFAVADYVDFYSSEQHASNVGQIFRPGQPPLPPNWKHLPIGYHGRAGTVVGSGTDVIRPSGQRRPADAAGPDFGPSYRLDIEAEVGFVVGPGTAPGTSVSTEGFRDHVFGAVLVNDWSARDIQAWEYQPLGPFLAKSFATTVSPWVVTLEALEPFRVPALIRPEGDPEPLPYLDDARQRERGGLDLRLEVSLSSERMRAAKIAPFVVSRNSLRHLYWTPGQLLTHHASNGCNLRPGDLIASGTVSGPTRESRGCLLELAWRGEQPITLPTGETRTFLEDGDEVIFRGWCEREGWVRIGTGECRGVVLPA